MTVPRPARLVLLLLVLTLTTFAAVAWRPISLAVLTEKVWKERTDPLGTVRGWRRWNRWTGRPWGGTGELRREWYVETGRLARSVHFRDRYGATQWDLDGSVLSQHRSPAPPGGDEMRWAPPWWWGIENERAPSAPDFVLDDEQWAAVRKP